jgi:hypothetical protein
MSKKRIKRETLIPIIILIGLLTLFLFPKPQSNFLLYILTIIIFTILIIYLTKKK